MRKENSQITEKEALSIYARMLHTLDSSELESFLSEDFSYSSQKVLTDMNSKDEFIEYIKPKLETIKKSKNPVYAELGVCPAYGHTDCLIMAQGDKTNLLGVAYASVDEGKICSLALCVVPTPDSAKRSGIYPGLNEKDLIESLVANKYLRRLLIICLYVLCIVFVFNGVPLFAPAVIFIPFYYLKKHGYWEGIEKLFFVFGFFMLLNVLFFKFLGGSEYFYLKLSISGIISAITFIYSKKINNFYESIWDLNFKTLLKKSTLKSLLLPKNKFGRLVVNVLFIPFWVYIFRQIILYYEIDEAFLGYVCFFSPIFFYTRYLWFEKSRKRIFYGIFDKLKFNLKQFNTEVFNTTSNADELKKYADLRDQGIITEEEFEAKKKKLLDL